MATAFLGISIELERAFRKIEQKVPSPIKVPWGNGFVFRYVEKTIHQALVQKLARLNSGLYAVDLLLEKGLFQEQGIMQRVVDEVDEDILFLSLAIINDDLTSRHSQYLDYFYAEEFSDSSDALGSHSSRGMVKREKIRSYVVTTLGQETEKANAAGKILTKAYSGFVHAASPHIMDMYGGYPPRFDINGSNKKFRFNSSQRDAWNVFYRAIGSTAFAAKAFKDDDLFSSLHSFAGQVYDGMQS